MDPIDYLLSLEGAGGNAAASRPDLKHVLVVDERGLTSHPPYNEFDFVDFVSEVDPGPENDDWYRARYGAVLVHGNTNPRVAAWASRVFGHHVRFVGEDAGGQDDGNVWVSRANFLTRVVPFLRAYGESGGVADYALFKSGGQGRGRSGKSQGGEGLGVRAGSDEGVATFTTGAGDPSRLAFPVVPRGASIDFEATLRPLAEDGRVRAVSLAQGYEGRPMLGLELLLRIRLSAFLGDVARLPISIDLDDPVDALVEADPVNVLLRSPGVFVGEPVPAGTGPLTEGEYIHGALNAVQVPSPDRPHVAANEWGAYRLDRGARALMGDGGAGVGVPHGAFYWQALSRGAVDGGRAGTSIMEDAEWKRWGRFLRQFKEEAGRPLRVLLVDDRAHAGWADAVRTLTGADEGWADVIPVGPETEDPMDLTYAERRVREVDWDVLLLDLRLRPEDDDVSDPAEIGGLSGANLLGTVRSVSKLRTRAVIAFTASSRSWTYRSVVTELGADDYWVKEHPGLFPTEAEGKERALALTRAVGGAVRRRRRIDPVWRLHEALGRASDDDEYLRGLTWEYGPRRNGTPSKKAVRVLVGEVRTRVNSAYRLLEGVELDGGGRPTDRFAQAVLDQAFLGLWSTTNVALEALVGLDGDGRYFFVGSRGEPVLYYRCSGRERLESPFRDKIRLVGKYAPQNVAPCGKTKASELKAETLGLILLVLSKDDRALARFQTVHGIRNKLLLTHGTEGDKAQADLETIKTMCHVIFDLFRIGDRR